jgi:hypothetical protein
MTEQKHMPSMRLVAKQLRKYSGRGPRLLPIEAGFRKRAFRERKT